MAQKPMTHTHTYIYIYSYIYIYICMYVCIYIYIYIYWTWLNYHVFAAFFFNIYKSQLSLKCSLTFSSITMRMSWMPCRSRPPSICDTPLRRFEMILCYTKVGSQPAICIIWIKSWSSFKWCCSKIGTSMTRRTHPIAGQPVMLSVDAGCWLCGYVSRFGSQKQSGQWTAIIKGY